MRMVIAGSRNFKGGIKETCLIKAAVYRYGITEIVSGGATGADSFGQDTARFLKIPVVVFNANWQKHGPIAGPYRNRQMAEYTNYVFLFPGGRGTGSMRNEAIRAGKKIIYDNGWIE